MNALYLFSNGVSLRQLSETSYEQLDLLGRHLGYLRAENIVVEPELSSANDGEVKP